MSLVVVQLPDQTLNLLFQLFNLALRLRGGLICGLRVIVTLLELVDGLLDGVFNFLPNVEVGLH